MGRNRTHENESDSFTSMIDIVFLLLIFFMLQPFRAPSQRLDSELPKKGRGGIIDNLDAVRLNLRGQGDDVRVTVNGHPAPAGGVLATAVLRSCAPHDPDYITVVIDADQAVYYRHVIHAYDQCLVAGVGTVNFADNRAP